MFKLLTYILERVNRQKRIYDVHINKKFIRLFLPENPIIIDCGAHDGSDSILLAKYKGSMVHSFEPVPDIYNRLKEKTKSVANIKTYEIALSDFIGEATMFVSHGMSDGSSSLLPPKDHLIDHPDVHFDNQLLVNCITLDEWARSNKIEKIDMLWLDMQGYELPMLKSSIVILPTVKVIHTEVSLRETYANVSQYLEFKEFLLSNGFKVEAEALPQGYDMGNVLFVRQSQ